MAHPYIKPHCLIKLIEYDFVAFCFFPFAKIMLFAVLHALYNKNIRMDVIYEGGGAGAELCKRRKIANFAFYKDKDDGKSR